MTGKFLPAFTMYYSDFPSAVMGPLYPSAVYFRTASQYVILYWG
jgi:hypothetical protein